jgi:hypothetical protein
MDVEKMPGRDVVRRDARRALVRPGAKNYNNAFVLGER